MNKRPVNLTVILGDSGASSRVLVEGAVISGVRKIKQIAIAGELSEIVITLYARDCEILNQDYVDERS